VLALALLAVAPLEAGWVWEPVGRQGGPGSRAYAVVVWTGRELVVWGGLPFGIDQPWQNDGWRYDPAGDSWSPLPVADAPEARQFPVGVWTGHELVVWGGHRPDLPFGSLQSGACYRPAENRWRPMTLAGAPSRRGDHTLTWTGSEVVVWGGENGTSYLNTGGRYDPATDSWTAMTTTGAPKRRADHTAVWTGSKLVVWGGSVLLSGGTGSYYYAHRTDFAAYDPVHGGWVAGATDGAPAARSEHSAVWTGSRMLVWGGWSSTAVYQQGLRRDGGSLDGVPGTWTELPLAGAPAGRAGHGAVWSGREMIVWGGSPAGGSGGRLDPAAGTWSAMPETGGPGGGTAGGIAWTGEALYVLYDGLFRACETGPYRLDGLPDDWQYEHFGAQAPEGAADLDPDGDGLPNDAEFGLGTDPKDPTDGDGGLVVSRGGSAGDRWLTLDFQRRNDFPGVTVWPEFSTDLFAWTAGDAAFQELAAIDMGNGYDRVSARTRPGLAAGPAGFVRLRVTRQVPP
jgi:hypothetical protein